MAARSKAVNTPVRIEESILILRSQKVLLDSTLAVLYGVQTKVLMQAVHRNRSRFPQDFMFQLSIQEVMNLKSQFGDGSSFSVERMPVTGHVRP